jgi:hypothetical protein
VLFAINTVVNKLWGKAQTEDLASQALKTAAHLIGI